MKTLNRFIITIIFILYYIISLPNLIVCLFIGGLVTAFTKYEFMDSLWVYYTLQLPYSYLIKIMKNER